MTLDELIAYVVPRIPFVSVEIRREIVQAAWEDSVSLYNKYNPIRRIMHINSMGLSYEFPADSVPESVLRVYFYDDIMFGNAITLISQWSYMKPVLNISGGAYTAHVTYNHTLADIDLNQHELLALYFIKDVCMKLADRRRAATVNELPFDIKGDTLYDGFKAERDDILQRIYNVTPIAYI